MLYTVAEISNMLGFSKATIYNKINSLETALKPCIKSKKGITHINEEGISIIKRDLGLIEDETTLNSEDKFKEQGAGDNIGLKEFQEIRILVETLEKTIETGQKDYINSLLEQNELLKLELNKKDEQINNTLRLLENSQILMKDSKEKILMLENKDEKEKKGFLNWFRK